jgi:hypothetical protein
MVSVTQERDLGIWHKSNNCKKECNQLKKNIVILQRNNDDLKKQVAGLLNELKKHIPDGDLIGMKRKYKPKKSIKKKNQKKTRSKSRFKRR